MVPLVESLNLSQVGCLRSTFGNFSPKANTLIRRLNRGVYRGSNRTQNTAPRDHRGPVVRTVETVQTFLTTAEVDHLVADYEAGAGVLELAEKYGIHRATVFAHLRRREVPRRHPGLSDYEQAEAVRLSQDGMSMRAIGRQMGVDRKAVRVALVDAGMLSFKSSDPPSLRAGDSTSRGRRPRNPGQIGDQPSGHIIRIENRIARRLHPDP
jgi:DNA-binding CsgD family transcriptional regulator